MASLEKADHGRQNDKGSQRGPQYAPGYQLGRGIVLFSKDYRVHGRWHRRQNQDDRKQGSLNG